MTRRLWLVAFTFLLGSGVLAQVPPPDLRGFYRIPSGPTVAYSILVYSRMGIAPRPK